MNKFPKDSQEYQKRKELLAVIDKNFPDRKTNYSYIDEIREPEKNMDSLIKMAIKKKYWYLYGVVE